MYFWLLVEEALVKLQFHDNGTRKLLEFVPQFYFQKCSPTVYFDL